MSARNLTQMEADRLLAMDKSRTDRKVRPYPDLGGKLTVPLVSTDGLEAFLLDLSRGRISLGREKLPTRARRTVVLARLDIGGRPHRNPDDSLIGSPHRHLYREGYTMPSTGRFRSRNPSSGTCPIRIVHSTTSCASATSLNRHSTNEVCSHDP